MENKLGISIENADNSANLKFSGTIDEDSNFDEVKSVEATSMAIDWQGVQSINSCGIREWTNCLKSINPDVTIQYKNCPIHVVEQINMIVDFVRKGTTVESLFAPYFCEDCDEERSILIKLDEVQDRKAPSKKCESCQAELEFDAMEAQFFSFVK